MKKPTLWILAALALASAPSLHVAAFAQTAPAPLDVVKIDHSTPNTAQVLQAFFKAKSEHDVNATMELVDQGLVFFGDASMGSGLPDYAAVKGLFSAYMPKWPKTAISYPVRILGGPTGALVEFVDTKELFGDELRIFATVDLKAGKVIRWVDLWDGANIDPAVYTQLRSFAPKNGRVDYRAEAVGNSGTPVITKVATQIQKALASQDADAAADMLSYEAVFEDRTAHTQIVGQASIRRYLARALLVAPYGKGATLQHVVGGDFGGGYQWEGAPERNGFPGMVAIELDKRGKITRLSVMYGGKRLPDGALKSLAELSVETR